MAVFTAAAGAPAQRGAAAAGGEPPRQRGMTGYKPTPGIKIATNSEMYARMSDDMDLNCGDIVTEGVPIEDKGRELFELMIRVASGEKTKSEELGFGGVEFVPWQIGAVM